MVKKVTILICQGTYVLPFTVLPKSQALIKYRSGLKILNLNRLLLSEKKFLYQEKSQPFKKKRYQYSGASSISI